MRRALLLAAFLLQGCAWQHATERGVLDIRAGCERSPDGTRLRCNGKRLVVVTWRFQ